MNRKVEKGKTLLVDGPASVTVVSGKVEVFGFRVSQPKRRIVIREGKRMPFFAEENAELRITLGKDASFEEADGNTVPPSWAVAAETLQELEKRPAVVMVVGGVDSGKTSLCTYLINRLLGAGCKVAILDCDVGQSDIGPPTTTGYARVAEPVTDLFALRAEDAFFVGVTSPSENVGRTLEGVAQMREKLQRCPVDFVVVNTDGWVLGEDALAYKIQLAETLAPDAFFCIQQADELAPLVAALAKFNPFAVASPQTVRLRSREKRRNLRELGYLKYLADAKVKVWSLRRVTVEPTVLCQNQLPLDGSLLGLHDAHGKFLGIGVLMEVDCERKTLKVRTAVSAEPALAVLGRVRVDERLHEVPSA